MPTRAHVADSLVGPAAAQQHSSNMQNLPRQRQQHQQQCQLTRVACQRSVSVCVCVCRCCYIVAGNLRRQQHSHIVADASLLLLLPCHALVCDARVLYDHITVLLARLLTCCCCCSSSISGNSTLPRAEIK